MSGIHWNNFLPSETLSFLSPSYFEAGRSYGKHMSRWIHSQHASDIKDEIRIRETLAYAEQLQTSSLFTFGTRNVLTEYLDLLYGYSDGADITREQALFQQLEEQSGCQTIIVQHAQDTSISLLHTEEHFADTHLMQIYAYMDSHPEWNPTLPLPVLMSSLYAYASVSSVIGSSSYSFFGYPELCFGGPAMGYINSTNTFICVDTISPKTESIGSALWANAVVSMMFLLGTISEARLLLQRLSASQLYVMNGYSVHMIDCASQEIASFEFGGLIFEEIAPITYKDRTIITQTNFPRSEKLQSMDAYSTINTADIWSAQFVHQMQRREERMNEIALKLKRPNTVDTKFLDMLFYTECGDIERYEYNSTQHLYSGLISPYLAGHATGVIKQGLPNIQIGKLYPYIQSVHPEKLYYDEHEHLPETIYNLYTATKKIRDTV